MTLQEFCKQYKVSETSVKTKWKRTQTSLEKKHPGCRFIKEGRGANVSYHVEYEDFDDHRANTFVDEEREEIMLANRSIGLVNWQFVTLLGIVTTPMLVFRGSYSDFLRYIEVEVNEANIAALKDALIDLAAADYIAYMVDKTDDSYFTASLYRQAETEMQVGIGMIRDCKLLANKYKMKSWVPLFKIWLGIEMLVEDQPFTQKRLIELTNTSEHYVKKCTNILQESNVFKKSKAYMSYCVCLGSNYDMNVEAFYNIS